MMWVELCIIYAQKLSFIGEETPREILCTQAFTGCKRRLYVSAFRVIVMASKFVSFSFLQNKSE